MMKRNFYVILFLSLVIYACGNGGTATTTTSDGTGDLEGFTMESSPNSTAKTAKKVNDKSEIIEQGTVLNGKREGTWLTYYDGRKAGVAKTSTSYINGEKHGAYFQFDNIGRIEMMCFYSKGILHGNYVKYQYGKPKEEATYVNGQLDGDYKTYYSNGKIQQETVYKNGKKDGRSVFYNEQEQIIMDYQYKDGEQVSGGKVEVPPTSAVQ